MKKFLLALIAVVAFSVTYAIVPVPKGSGYPSCTITGDPQYSKIDVFDHYISGNVVKVELSNESDNTKANVTVTVEFTYKSCSSCSSKTETRTGRIRSTPDKDKDICEVVIPDTFLKVMNEDWGAASYKVTAVTGNKCN